MLGIVTGLLAAFALLSVLAFALGRFRASQRISQNEGKIQQPSPSSETQSKYSHAVGLRGARPASNGVAGKAASRPSKRIAVTEEQVDRLIQGLPKRTLEELRQQWLNLVRLDVEQSSPVHRFRKALLVEWERRSHLARTGDDYFKWPSTHGGNGDGSMRFDGWYEAGMLKYFGYQVGENQGESDETRRQILDVIFTAALPPINDPEYMRGWGEPNSSYRLKRLANEIARFVRNGKNKRSADMSSAITDWETDLQYLYHEYYVRRFRFSWPR